VSADWYSSVGVMPSGHTESGADGEASAVDGGVRTSDLLMATGATT